MFSCCVPLRTVPTWSPYIHYHVFQRTPTKTLPVPWKNSAGVINALTRPVAPATLPRRLKIIRTHPPPLIIHRRRTRVLPTRPIEPVTAATPAASTQLISSVGTPVATTETGVPTTSPSTKKPLPLGSLICTVQTPFGNNFAHAPPDGLCTIIMAYPFYGYQAITLDPALYEFEGVSSILDVAEKQTKTEYGIGIDFNFCGSLHDMTMLLKDRGTELAMRLLWTKRVYHYGQINPPLGRQDNLTTLISNCGKGLQVRVDCCHRVAGERVRLREVCLFRPLCRTSVGSHCGFCSESELCYYYNFGTVFLPVMEIWIWVDDSVGSVISI
ncbi:hypothetical protein MRX96_026681 [Rhipicephalus microplus]